MILPERSTKHLRLASWLTVLVLVHSAYLWAAGNAGIFYVANVLAHPLLGLALLGAWFAFGRTLRTGGERSTPALATAATSAVALTTGLVLIVLGNLRPQQGLLLVHIAASLSAAACALWWLWQTAGRAPRTALRVGAVALGLVVLVGATRPYWPTAAGDRIDNPVLPPLDLAGEAMGGAEGPFFPSAAATVSGDTIPASFFLQSETCGRVGCHPDITDQWKSSAHRFSSFNNQWYRKSIEYMQDVVGLEPPKWCAGCHDHALLFSGRMEQPVEDFLDDPAAHAGLGCVSCHSVAHVKGTMGNGGIVMEYPELHDLAASDNPVVQTLHDLVLRLDPEPHRRAFLKPFHREQTAEFCSSCHKVHLDVAVNSYRWIRGFNEYDNWQASGVSGEGARSFYAPAQPLDCASCHMPLIPSDDAGNQDGYVHSHRFPAANTAVPMANLDETQLQETVAFLQRQQLRVDIFAVSEPSAPAPAAVAATRPGTVEAPRQATTFAVGEEQGAAIGGGSLTTEAVPVLAPLSDGAAVLRPGSSARLDVVVRTLGLGHFFPGGTVDAQEAWLEVKAVDQGGRVLLWSGWTEGDDDTVDPSAHFYRSRMVDAHANLINKRNAWSSRAVVYVNLIPPGAADIAHYRLQVPADVAGPVTVTAQLHYRKFDAAHTAFSFAGQPTDAGQKSPHYDDRTWGVGEVPANVSAQMREIPALPIVTMAADTVRLAVTQAPAAAPAPDAGDRWNDYGIGLLLEGDLKGAEKAFARVTELRPTYVDGWVNLARVYLQEGDLDAAETTLAQAEKVQPDFHKTRYFRGILHKELGEYDAALRDLNAVAAKYPRDRVVLNQIGRVHYLRAEPAVAVAAFEKVLAIDSEDLMAHYNLMLSYRALGDLERSGAHEARYLRYKDDETTQALAREYRQRHPHDNNEALPIHEHGGQSRPQGGPAGE